ncbi:sigma-70 family RNA polymerase sigma factor [Ilumatobacter sp.]|uniref:sigma-70 family RNA polymerase sigma factor n=1 Tax=Ilumatobacter sp. TaxID=1967498 RepID=UPI003C46E393
MSVSLNDPLLDGDVHASGPATDGPEQAALYDDRRVPMTRLAYLLTGSVAVAEELVHDAFEQVVRRWDSIDNPGGYLRVAVVNGARSWGRRRREIPLPPLENHPAIDADAIAVRAALADLRHDEREALVLRYYAGLTDSQIAYAVDRPIGTIKSQIHRGLERMRKELA